MSNMREAAQQALEAWERSQRWPYGVRPDKEFADLRAALAEPVQKPWRCACGANLYIDENGAPMSKAEPVIEPVSKAQA